MSAVRETIHAGDAPAAIGPYSHGVAEQARRCLANLQAVARAGGTTLERALRITIYMVDLGAFAEVNQVCEEFFATDPPARATVGVAALPRGSAVEIDAIIAV